MLVFIFCLFLFVIPYNDFVFNLSLVFFLFPLFQTYKKTKAQMYFWSAQCHYERLNQTQIFLIISRLVSWSDLICVLCKAQQLTHKNSRPLPTQYLKYKQTPGTGNNKMKYLFHSQVSSFLFCLIYSFVIQFLSNDMRFNIINFCSFDSFLFHKKKQLYEIIWSFVYSRSFGWCNLIPMLLSVLKFLEAFLKPRYKRLSQRTFLNFHDFQAQSNFLLYLHTNVISLTYHILFSGVMFECSEWLKKLPSLS